MTAKNQNAEVYAGDYVEIELPVRDPSGESISATGLTARYKATYASTTAINKSPEDIDITTKDGTAYLKITLLPEDTENLPPRAYYHEIEVVDSIERPFTVMTGTLIIRKTIIKPVIEDPIDE